MARKGHGSHRLQMPFHAAVPTLAGARWKLVSGQATPGLRPTSCTIPPLSRLRAAGAASGWLASASWSARRPRCPVPGLSSCGVLWCSC